MAISAATALSASSDETGTIAAVMDLGESGEPLNGQEMTQDPERYLGLAGFRQALRRFIAASETINREAGTTPQQYQAMLAIKTWPYETMSMKDLAEQLLLTHHAAVQLVDRLAKSGLAAREASNEDRRSVQLSLTDKGASLLDDLAAKHMDELLRQEPMLTSSLRRLKRMGQPEEKKPNP